MQCNKCRRNAVLFQEYSGQHLCRQHFEADIESKAKHEIRRNRWILPGDHIAVALSGDQCSSALLYFLKKLTSNRRDIRISAILIDQGILGYHHRADAMRIAELMNTKCITGSFLENFGTTIDEISQTKDTALTCTYCRVLRTFLVNRIAKEHGITKLALGDTLDDGAVSLLKNVLQGTPEVLVHSKRAAGRKIPLIRPFMSVPYKEVALYAVLHVKGYNQSGCPYNYKPFEEDVQEMLNGFTIRHPATKYTLLSLEKNLTGLCFLEESVPSCHECGDPADSICLGCRIINEVTARGT